MKYLGKRGSIWQLLVIAIFLFLGLRFMLVGYLFSGDNSLADVSFLKQAVAQEEPLENVEMIGSSLPGGLDLESLRLLDKKRKDLEDREAKLKKEEERLNKLKAEITRNLEDMIAREEGIDKRIKELVTLRKTLEEEELKKLAQVFESTPPEQAGPMFNKLDVNLAAKILFRMKGRYAGKIWGYVDPEQAVRISNELSTMEN